HRSDQINVSLTHFVDYPRGSCSGITLPNRGNWDTRERGSLRGRIFGASVTNLSTLSRVAECWSNAWFGLFIFEEPSDQASKTEVARLLIAESSQKGLTNHQENGLPVGAQPTRFREA